VLGFLFPLIGILAAGFAVPREQAGANPSPPAAHRPDRWPQAESRDQLMKPSAALATLRPSGDPKTQAFLEYNDVALGAALSACEAGERVLAFGRGEWDERRVVFLLTDRGLVLSGIAAVGDSRNSVLFEGVAGPQERSEVILVGDIDDFEVDNFNEYSPVFVFAQGGLRLDRTSPFTSSEIEELIGRREQPGQYVEMAGPGEVVGSPERVRRSPSPESEEPVDGVISELERLDTLRQSGAIDDAEFAELKRRAMWGDEGPTESSDLTGEAP
jgi:hypothetical protein